MRLCADSATAVREEKGYIGYRDMKWRDFEIRSRMRGSLRNLESISYPGNGAMSLYSVIEMAARNHVLCRNAPKLESMDCIRIKGLIMRPMAVFPQKERVSSTAAAMPRIGRPQDATESKTTTCSVKCTTSKQKRFS